MGFGLTLSDPAFLASDDAILPTANLIAQWEADSLVLSNNDPVATWLDQSASARNATQASAAARPLYQTNIFGTAPALFFDGSNDQLDFTIASVPNFTVFAVMIVLSGTTTFGGPLQWDGAVGPHSFQFNGDSGGDWSTHLTTINAVGTETNNKKGDALTFGTKHLITWSYDGTTVLGRNNGVAMTLANGATGYGTTSGRIGAAFSHFRGNLAALCVYDAALSAANKVVVEGYLNSKYPCF